MRIIWLGHSSFRIEIAGQILLIDPWLTGNPMLPSDDHASAVAGATHLILTHGHDDHAGDARVIASDKDLPLYGPYELVKAVKGDTEIRIVDFNKGGTIDLNGIALTIVNAVHSSSYGGDAFCGTECGYMIAAESHTIYLSGDTDIMADMEWMADLHKPDIGLLCAGGIYTMDMARAAYAAKRYFNFKTVIPSHYRTSPRFEQNADTLKAALPDVDVIEPQVLEPITL
ncbi:metal-dependent hydrolase [Actibacterium sp. 188UL27-1]|uniref:metal-dependent hydrolase n=1 Tax=Actibacterium sp. 188UL27-1 TaxID=2786961 RepID=UPI00195C2897|nr:metal-dependent hydrolase [Actibacterium sp. 188UL27-1]MBM7066661.1 metal-dependent hydrolase [Actibacterium sp. 188UL27-1]